MRILILLFTCLPTFLYAQVGIGTSTPNASAQLDVSSTTKGFLPPRMTQAQRQNINSPIAGLMVYQTDGTAGLWYYTGNTWIYIINSTTATLPIANGGTGETTITGVKSILGLNGANVAIGSDAGTTTQGSQAIAIGSESGKTTQGGNAIAIGAGSGRNSQGLSAIGIGYVAGDVSQGTNGIAIGSNAAQSNQSTEAVAIGYAAGQYGQGAKAVAIGSFAGNSGQTAGSIAINASGVALNPTTAGLYINPIRSNAATNSYLNYDATTKEVTYSSGLAAGSVSTTTINDGAVTDAKIGTVSGSKVTGDISGNAANVTGIISVAKGGTGASTLTANSLLVGNGTSAVSLIAPGTSGNVLVSNGNSWSSNALDYGFVKYTGADTGPLVVNTHVWLDASATGNLTYSDYKFTLKANKTYELEAYLAIFQTNGAVAGKFQIFDFTNSTILASGLYISAGGAGTNNPSSNGPMKAIITPTQDISVGIKFTSFYGGGGNAPGLIGSATTVTSAVPNQCYFYVKQIR